MAGVPVRQAAVKRYVALGGGRTLEILEKGFFARQRTSDNVNSCVRQPVRELENPVRPLEASDIAHPQHVDVARGNRLRLLHQHSRHSARQSVAARKRLLLPGALYEDGIGPAQTVSIQPA